MAKVPDNGSQSTPDHIEQIRDIIFGPQKRDYDQRFEKLNADIHCMKEELAKLQKDMNAGDKKTLAELETRSKAMIESIGSLRQDLGDTRRTLQSEQQAQKELLTKNLEEQVSALSADKASRDMLAELLQAMALQLKGTAVMEELRKAVRKAPAE